VDDDEVQERVPADEEDTSSEDEKTTAAQSYSNLLSVLKSQTTTDERPQKRRKIENGANGQSNHQKDDLERNVNGVAEERGDVEAVDLAENADENVDDSEGQLDSDDEDFVLHDPFEQHYTEIQDKDKLKDAIERQNQRPVMDKSMVGNSIRKLVTSYETTAKPAIRKRNAKDLHLKKRLADTGSAVSQNLPAAETDLLHEMFAYRDVVCGFRVNNNAASLRDLASLHALNHVFKTRDRVLKNNAKMAQATTDGPDYRDQGFTRPKVLVLLPTKQSCVRYVESIIRLSKPDQQESRGRFLDTYSQAEDDTFENKPEDFRELFAGNHEEDFRMGLKFTRKTIKFFSGFYNSDIIFASPLGLMRTVTTGGGNAKEPDAKKEHNADFLSSIEIVIMDQATALEQQNWSHVDYVFSQLNLVPRESHGGDLTRARQSYLDGRAKYLRQTIIFAAYLTPSIQSLASAHLHNIAGRVKYTPAYNGAMLELSPSIPLTITQSFLRFDSSSPQTDSDTRFKFFASTILPQLLRSSSKANNKGTLLFVPTYLDFVRLRNHFSTAAETTSLSFSTISEYSSRGDVARSRSHFLSGRHSVLLYTERAHHYFRYKLRGVRRLIFYGLPDNALFWTEMIDMLGANAMKDVEWAENQRGKQGKGLVRAIFSKWDVMKLERIVGTERVGKLVSESQGDVFEFV